MTALFIASLNEMIDTHGLRLAAIRHRIQPGIWAFLFLTAGISMLSIGYQAGLSGSRRSVAAIALVVAFSGVIMLIADLDRPQRGFLRVNQQAMIDLQAEHEVRDACRDGGTPGSALTHRGVHRSNTRLFAPAPSVALCQWPGSSVGRAAD